MELSKDGFWCKWRSNSQQKTLPVELSGTHTLFESFKIK